MRYLTALLLLAWLALPAMARNPLDFTLLQLQGDLPGPTILVVGGIQGDEPGGFNAAGMLASHYTIRRGNVWVVPNLNFPSIINRSRGLHGDMNRKFAQLRRDDPEYDTVERIKAIIRHPQVDMVINLHDGSGFYHPQWQDTTRNPHRWGQCVIIDQADINAPRFGKLDTMAAQAVADVNNALLRPYDQYHLKNTHTRDGDTEMEKTLTYFAINNGKPAFGVEASKSFGTATRAYYHIQVLESFLRQAGVEFTRDFPLSPQGLEAAMSRNLQLAFHNGKFLLDMQNVRSTLRYVPLSREAATDFTPSKPLLTLVDDDGGYRVYYGNNRLTHLMPQYFEYDDSLESLRILVDGQYRTTPMGSIVPVSTSFTVAPMAGYRVNIIGVTRPGVPSECGMAIRKSDFLPGFSVDTEETLYRVEVYRGSRFSGMVLVRFTNDLAPSTRVVTTESNRDRLAVQDQTKTSLEPSPDDWSGR